MKRDDDDDDYNDVDKYQGNWNIRISFYLVILSCILNIHIFTGRRAKTRNNSALGTKKRNKSLES